ncbi:hypothetical protein B879_04198 [Cecembia lonarensis LW9]|uniref:Uncharacterized protein n=1 Tax=Cecembia lonarensis (strain CCUG 58316 / KCTC 22772 / LW9) TaxID=1225176 RepID=K1L9Y1_CECL9|nr:hypothetical protein B879_04198 [Cecembia lonarensis LW9]
MHVEEVRHVNDVATISRQFEPSTRKVFQDQSLHSSVPKPGISGMMTSAGGGLPSGSFQTKSRPFVSMVSQAAVRARSGTRWAYGTSLHLPSPPQRQSWNGHEISSPLISPLDRSPPMWRQKASSTLSLPLVSAQMTTLVPKTLTVCGLPLRKSLARPRQCQPRAKRVGLLPASMRRTSSNCSASVTSVISVVMASPISLVWCR